MYPMEDIAFTQGEEFRKIKVHSKLLPGSGLCYDLADIDVRYYNLIQVYDPTNKGKGITIMSQLLGHRVSKAEFWVKGMSRPYSLLSTSSKTSRRSIFNSKDLHLNTRSKPQARDRRPETSEREKRDAREWLGAGFGLVGAVAFGALRALRKTSAMLTRPPSAEPSNRYTLDRIYRSLPLSHTCPSSLAPSSHRSASLLAVSSPPSVHEPCLQHPPLGSPTATLPLVARTTSTSSIGEGCSLEDDTASAVRRACCSAERRASAAASRKACSSLWISSMARLTD